MSRNVNIIAMRSHAISHHRLFLILTFMNSKSAVIYLILILVRVCLAIQTHIHVCCYDVGVCLNSIENRV